MKKGLVVFTIISVTSLLLTLSVTYILYDMGIIEYKSGTAASVTDMNGGAANQEDGSAASEGALTADGTEGAQEEQNQAGEGAGNAESDMPDVTGGDFIEEAPSPEPSNDEEEPDIPGVTPEPDMDPDTWDYVKSGDYNMIFSDKKKVHGKMPYVIKVNKQMNTVTVYGLNKKGKYTKAVRAMVCSVGSATPLGSFNTSDKYYWKAMIHGVWAQYATRITGKILFHSVPYDTHEKDTLITGYYNKLGNVASAGCVRLSVQDAKWLVENCPSGTRVEIYNSSDPGPLGKPNPIRIPYGCTWDPTDPDERNPWKNKKTAIIGVKDRTIERCGWFNAYDNIIAYDKKSNSMTVNGLKVSGEVDPSKAGSYEITYIFKPSDGKKIKKKAVITVVDTTAPVIGGIPADIYVRDASKIDEKYLIDKTSLTDNGMSLSKKHLKVTLSGNKAVLTARDDYNHSTTFTTNIVEDNVSPVIRLKGGLKKVYPVSYRLSKDAARKRIKSVSDNVNKFSAKDVGISVKPNNWGITVTYSVSDYAGNKGSVSETISFETASLKVVKDNINVGDIDDKEILGDNVKLVSDATGKKVDCKLSVSHKKTGENEKQKIYKVSYTATYKSMAGKKTATAVCTAYVDK